MVPKSHFLKCLAFLNQLANTVQTLQDIINCYDKYDPCSKSPFVDENDIARHNFPYYLENTTHHGEMPDMNHLLALSSMLNTQISFCQAVCNAKYPNIFGFMCSKRKKIKYIWVKRFGEKKIKYIWV